MSGVNWLDVIFLTILLGMIYKGSRAGVGSQLLSLVWAFVLVFFSIGFYSGLASSMFGFILQSWARAISFFIIASILFVAIKFLEMIFGIEYVENISPLERIGGAVVAAMRTVLLFGLVCILFLLLPIPFLQNAVAKGSKTGMVFVRTNAHVYSRLSDHLKFVKQKDPDEVVNEIFKSSGELEGIE